MTRWDRFALCAALACPWLFIWQGLDFTDQGYLLTGYRCFLRYPAATADSGDMWLTYLVGAGWDALFGGLGVISQRALWALCMSLCIVLAFWLARHLTDARAAGVSALATSAFLSDRHMTWFSYNTLTSVLLAGAAVCLLRGVWQERSRWLFAAGALLGASPFARFPNVLGWALISALVFAAWLEPERRQRLPRALGVVLLGIGAGLGGMLLLILLRGDSALYFSSVRNLFKPSAQDAGYAPGTLFSNFLKDEGLALAWGLGVCVGALALSRSFRRIPKLAACAVLPFVCAFGIFLLTYKAERWRWIVPGATYLFLGAVALGQWKRSFELRVAAYVVLMVVVVAPLGSNLGIKNAHMGLWLALPLLLASLKTLGAEALAGQGPKLALLGSLVLAGEGVHRAATYTYRDSARIRLRAAVHDPQLRAQYTSPARAKSVSEVLAALEQRVAPEDYLLAYEGTPLLQYLTRTRPYLDRSWLMSWERGDAVAALAAAAPGRTGCLPVAVRTTGSTRGFEWPEHPLPLEQGAAQRGVRAALGTFLREHAYTRTWSNGFFEILEPPPAERSHCR
jgi:hypothetical protein